MGLFALLFFVSGARGYRDLFLLLGGNDASILDHDLLASFLPFNHACTLVQHWKKGGFFHSFLQVVVFILDSVVESSMTGWDLGLRACM